MSGNSFIILNGEMLKNEEAFVSPANRGMIYGDGCFETLGSYKGQFLRWNAHFNRLKNGLDYLEMDLPFSADELSEMVKKLLHKNQLLKTDAILRIQCWREGGRGYGTTSRKPSYSIHANNIQLSKEPILLTVAETRCIPNKSLDRRYKLSNGLNYIKAAKEAFEAGCEDALMLTVDDFISETTIANLFWIKNHTVYTPSVQCDLLPGITRSIIIELCHQNQIPVQEGTYKLVELDQAEAVFRTNSLIELQEVKGIDELSFEMNHPVFVKLTEAFNQFKSAELKE